MMKNYGIFLFVLIILMPRGASGQSADQTNETTRLINISTTMGNMVVRLYNETPAHRDNMIKLIEEGFYKDLLFHRVIKDFMIQGGDPQSAGAGPGERLGNGGPGYTIPAEFNENLYHKKGALAAARMGDQVNPEKESSGSQFYLVQGRVFTEEELATMKERGMGDITDEAAEVYQRIGGTPHLDGSYTVFGEIVEGMDVLERISEVPTDRFNRPLTDVVFSITLVK
jgi:peptidyl-prolyl cis-trans isomerase B (cyclophilin B)